MFSLVRPANGCGFLFDGCHGGLGETAVEQGLTLAHFSAQRKRCRCDRGSIEGLSGGCLGRLRRYEGMLRV